MSNSPSARADREINRQKRVREIRRATKPGSGFKVHEFTPYQYRINDRLDIFPTNNRWHDIVLNRRGVFTGIHADNFIAGYFRQLAAAPAQTPDDGKDAMIALLEGLVARGYRLFETWFANGGMCAKDVNDWKEDVHANGINVNR